MESSSSKKSYIALIATAAIWGTSFLFITTSVEAVGDNYFVSLFFRLLFGLLSSAILFLVLNIKVMRSQLFYFKRKVVYILAFLNFGGLFFQFIAATLTVSHKLALLVNCHVIFVPFISYLMLKERLNYKRIIGIIIGIIGLILLVTGGNFQTLLEGELLGDIYCLIAAVFWAFYIVLTRKLFYKNEENSKSIYKPLNLSLITTILSFILLLPLIPFYFSTFGITQSFTLNIWLQFLYLGIICSTFAYLLYFYGLKSISATNASFILLVEPTVAIILGILILSEVFLIFSIIGASLIITSIAILSLT
ncbi:MAG TPA: DMT family transporter [Candidatus Deferrimicrobium sp.]|nr:DMT family transporter [Candidatus Deferrimicrobium sp.]